MSGLHATMRRAGVRGLGVAIAAGSALAVGLFAMASFWWLGQHHPDLAFLGGGPGHWIVPPLPLVTRSRPIVGLEGTFQRSFEFDARGAADQRPVWLRTRAFGRASVSVNGTVVLQPDDFDANWKRTRRVDVAQLLRPGINKIAVAVEQSKGPPALNLALSTPGEGTLLGTDESWQVSVVGSTLRRARLATRRPAFDPVLPEKGQQDVVAALLNSLPALLVFGVVSALLVIVGHWLARCWSGLPRARRRWLPWLGPGLAVLSWIALYANNATHLPAAIGFDLPGHLAYIDHILSTQSLPRANEGWQMYQPPLFYLSCAGVLRVLGLTTAADPALPALRAVTVAAGIAQVLLLAAVARVLWPENRLRQLLALGFAACLPMHLYLFQYVSNETLAMPLSTATSLLVLRLLLRDTIPSTQACLGLGACFGFALLARFSAVLLAPFVAAALAGQLIRKRVGWRIGVLRLGLALATCVIVCGWHFGRVWIEFGNPLAGNWDPSVGFHWWQDPGYRTIADYLTFGHSLGAPWFGGFAGVGDGVYSTLWGDGLVGGKTEVLFGPPWNHRWMAAGYALAVLPSLAILIGGLVGLWRLARRRMRSQRRQAGLYLAGIAAVTLLALLYMTLKVPSYAQSKAFYVQPAVPALCTAFVIGADWLLNQCRGRHAAWLRSALLWLLGIWAAVAYASVWVLPSRPPALAQRGHRLLQEGSIDAAEQHFLRALRGDPDQAVAQLGLAWVHAAGGDWPAVGLAARLALDSAPPSSRSLIARALTVLAHSDLRAGRIAAAEESVRRAIRLAPGERSGHVLLASLLLSRQREDEAIEALEDQLGAFPTERSVQLQLAFLYRARLDPRSAARHLGHALRLDPSDSNVRRALANSLAASGEDRRAADVLRGGLDSEP